MPPLMVSTRSLKDLSSSLAGATKFQSSLYAAGPIVCQEDWLLSFICDAISCEKVFHPIHIMGPVFFGRVEFFNLAKLGGHWGTRLHNITHPQIMASPAFRGIIVRLVVLTIWWWRCTVADHCRLTLLWWLSRRCICSCIDGGHLCLLN